MSSSSCMGYLLKHEKKPTANRREPQSFALLSASGFRPSLESALLARRIGFADPHSRSSCLVARQSLARKHSVCSAKIAGCAVDPPPLRLSAFSVQPAINTTARPFIGSGLATKSTTSAEQIVRFATKFLQETCDQTSKAMG